MKFSLVEIWKKGNSDQQSITYTIITTKMSFKF